MPEQELMATGSTDKLMERYCPPELIIQGLINEATYYGEKASHAARVSAWATLAKLAKLGGESVDIDRDEQIAVVNVTIRKVKKVDGVKIEEIDDALIA